MAKIQDFKTSTPKRANATYTWAWEVIVQEYDERSEEYVDNIVARFFDPWKAVQYGIDHYVKTGPSERVARFCKSYHTETNKTQQNKNFVAFEMVICYNIYKGSDQIITRLGKHLFLKVCPKSKIDLR